jgi:tetratricopeptide (TPR) repeat protein
VLGPTFHRDELAHVLDAATRDGAAASAIDVDVGLAELAERGIIRGGPCWELRHRTLATGLADLLADADRRRLHRFALEYWIDRDDRDAALEARARHARACGEVELAAQSWAALAGRAREDHRYEAADRYYTAALDAGSADAHLYIRRGAVRIATYRLDDAIADLETAYERATSAAEQLEAALELATALDFAERPADSARWTERARELGDGGDPRARARLALSGARVLYRRHRWDEAVAALENAVDLAAAAGDPETRIAGLLILATGLVIAGRPGDAADRFDEVIELCRATGDRVHLAIAYSQRPWLWSARDTPDRGVGPAARRRHRPRRRPAADRVGRDPQPRRDVALVGRSRRGASPGRARLRAADPLRRGAGPRRRAAAGAGADRGRRPRGRPGFAGLDRRERQRRARRDPRAVDRNGRVGARRLARRVLGSA